MIQMRTILEVADNSGARKLGCIKVLGGTRRKYATLGDIIIVSVKDALPNSKIKKGDVARAVIVRTRKEVRRLDGSYIKFDDIAKRNSASLAISLRTKRNNHFLRCSPNMNTICI